MPKRLIDPTDGVGNAPDRKVAPSPPPAVAGRAPAFEESDESASAWTRSTLVLGSGVDELSHALPALSMVLDRRRLLPSGLSGPYVLTEPLRGLTLELSAPKPFTGMDALAESGEGRLLSGVSFASAVTAAKL